MTDPEEFNDLWEMIDEYVNENDSGDMKPLVQMILDDGWHRTPYC